MECHTDRLCYCPLGLELELEFFIVHKEANLVYLIHVGKQEAKAQ